MKVELVLAASTASRARFDLGPLRSNAVAAPCADGSPFGRVLVFKIWSGSANRCECDRCAGLGTICTQKKPFSACWRGERARNSPTSLDERIGDAVLVPIAVFLSSLVWLELVDNPEVVANRSTPWVVCNSINILVKVKVPNPVGR